ncbi:autotransporter-associated beta strand repeat-containing protein [Achromobacter aegrifaciens]|uniref:Autotransporter-associated beta strand repeat-containing protein n=1 Tax=Achromobacter aegrifaciens TaxID=1287736 RepID=A0ABU2DM64_ACHAE|nr:autotransporter-associated beta strand repeat-containing protein [Achromobacter aegrifaciens]MDR7949208.1 autotransporter-associated beta strand repeat-containing protein [Achromobacter aegrifaciens]
MNRIYRVVFNAAVGVWQAVSEIAGGPGKGRQRPRRARRAGLPTLTAATTLLAAALGNSAAYAACTPVAPADGTTLTCSGTVQDYFVTGNDLLFDIQNGATVSSSVIGLPSMHLLGRGITVNNSGVFDPTGGGTFNQSTTALKMEGGVASNLTITNSSGAAIYGASGNLPPSLSTFDGMAIEVKNAGGGLTAIDNNGTIGSRALSGAIEAADARPVIAVYGGGRVHLNNRATIHGRVAFETSGQGNVFTNSGTIYGSVSLGAGSTNQFIAVTGSSVSGSGSSGVLGNNLGVNLAFAPVGIVDGGANGNNTLTLRNGFDSSAAGSGAIFSSVYTNFSNLQVEGGTWAVNGALLSGAATSTSLTGGELVVDNGGFAGSGVITAAGGTLRSSASQLTVNNPISLALNVPAGTNGLTVTGSNAITLNGAISGSAGATLTKTGSGKLTLGGINTFSGFTTIDGGRLDLAAGASLASGMVNVRSGGTLGGSGALSGAVTVAGGGRLALSSGNTLTTGSLTLSNGATLDLALGAPSLTPMVNIQGNLSITSSTFNIIDAGNLANGNYRLFNYTGSLTGTNLVAASTPSDLSTVDVGRVFDIAGKTLTLVINSPTLGTQYWDGGNTVANGVVEGGSGIWNSVNSNWTKSSGNDNGVWKGTNAVFLGQNGLVMVNGAQDVRAMQFKTDGYIVGQLDASGALNLINGSNGIAQVITDTDVSALIGAPIQGAGKLTKTGAGSLILSGNNSWTGGTALSAGTVVVRHDRALGTGSVALGSGTTLATDITDVALANSQVLNGVSTVQTGVGTNLTLNGNVSGVGGLIKAGSGTLTLNGVNNMLGNLNLTGGRLVIGNPLALGTGILNAINGTSIEAGVAGMNVGTNVWVSGTVALVGDRDLTLSGTLSGTGDLVKQGNSKLSLTGANALDGQTTLNGGGLRLGQDTSLGNTLLNVNSASTLQAANSITVANEVHLGAALTVDGANSLALTGEMRSGGDLIKNGNGTLILGGSNLSRSGVTTLNAGTLALGHDKALGSGRLDVAGTARLDSTAFVTLANAVDISGSLTFAGTQGLALTGTLSGNGGLTKSGASTLTLSGVNTFGGVYNIDAGRLIGSAAIGLGSPSQVNVASGATLQLNQGGSAGQLNGAGSVDLRAGSFNVQAGSFSGALNGNGGLNKTGNGSLVLSGNSILAGATTVDAGTLRVDGTLGSGSVAVASGATLTGSGTLTGAVSIADGGRLGLVSGATLRLGALALNGDSQIDAALGVASPNAPALAKVAGNLSLDGKLNIIDTGGFGIGVYRLFDYVGTLTDRGLAFGTLPSGVRANDLEVQTSVASQVNLVVGGTSNVRFWDGSEPAGNGNVEGGSGVWNSSNTNWTIASGGFNAGWNDSFAVFAGSPGTVTVEGTQRTTGMQFTSDGYLLTAGAAGKLELVDGSAGYAAIRVDAGKTATLNVDLGGNATLAKLDAGTLALNGNNSYTGGTRLAGGKLLLGTGSALGSGSLRVTGAAALDSSAAIALSNAIALDADLTLAGSNNLALNGDIAGAGGLVKLGSGTLELNGNNQYSGNTQLNAGTLILGQQAALGSGRLHVTGAAHLDTASSMAVGNRMQLDQALTVDGSHDLLLSGAIGGNGDLIKQGNATLTLTGPNSATGDTIINAGRLVASATSIGSGAIINNAALELNQASDAILTQTISGSGSLIKTGDATLVLTGANTSTGGTAINAGRLVASAASLGSGAIANHAALELNQAVDATLSQAISGGGSLTKTGAGTLSLTGANTSSGVTLINAGRLIASSHSLGSGAIINNAALELNQAVDGALAQAISGGGSLSKTGAGTLTLTGTNTYTGATLINAGRLVASAASLGSGAIINNAALELNQAVDASMAQAFSGSGSLSKTGAGALTLTGANTSTGATFISAGRLVASAANLGSGVITNNAALELRQTLDASMGQTLLGNGSLTKTGAGTLTLTGDSSGFAGSTTVQQSYLVVDGNLGGALTVAGGGKLAGTGSVGSSGAKTIIQSGGALAAGLSPDAATPYGTLRVQGDLELQAGSTYEVRADPDSSASTLTQVAGTATLAGGVVHMGAPGSFEVAKTYSILSANSLIGRFDTVASDYAYLAPTLNYTSTDVTLQLRRKSNGSSGSMTFADLAETRNQTAVANGAESLAPASALYRYVETLPAGTPQAVFDSLSGESHATAKGSMRAGAAMFGASALNHLHGNLTATLRPGAPTAQSGGPIAASAWPASSALPMWAEVVGHWQNYAGDGNAASWKQNTGGLFLGGDAEVAASGWRLGGSLGYTRADGQVSDRSSKATVDSYSAAIYGGKSFGLGAGRLNVMGGLAYTWHDIASQRQVTSLSQTLKADYHASTTQVFAEVGYAMGQDDKAGIEPFAGVSLGQQRTRGFQESGGFAALRGNNSSDDLASTTLGVRAHSDFAAGGRDGRLRATLGWRHAFGDLATQSTMAFEGGQDFTVAGVPLARNAAVVGLEAEVDLSNRAALALGYNGESGGGNRDQSAQVRVRWAF